MILMNLQVVDGPYYDAHGERASIASSRDRPNHPKGEQVARREQMMQRGSLHNQSFPHRCFLREQIRQEL